MKPREKTSTGILLEYHQNGTLPADMMPVREFEETTADPTKPLRGSLEAILLARSLRSILRSVSRDLNQRKGKSEYKWQTLPVREIDKEESLGARVNLLKQKQDLVMISFFVACKASLERELARAKVSPKVRVAYDQLIGANSLEEQADQITGAVGTFKQTSATLFEIAGEEYAEVVGFDPKARQMVDLVGNSYRKFVYPQTRLHPFAELRITAGNLGTDYEIDVSTPVHEVALKGISYYHAKENRMRKAGAIASRTIHCPFAMDPQFTNPFLPEHAKPLEVSPLQLAFEAVVRKHIGS